MSDAPLTSKQKEVLDYMVDVWNRKGVPATIRDIGSKFDIKSPNGVMSHLKALEKKGYVLHGGNGAHSWRPKYRTIEATCPHCDCEIEIFEEMQ